MRSERTEVTRGEESPFLQPSESSQVCRCFPTWFRPLRNCHLDCTSFTDSSLIPGLFLLPSPQNPSCAFLPCSSQQPLPSCSLPNSLCDSLRFSLLPRLDFRSSFPKSPLSCWDSAKSPSLQDSPLTQSLSCNPGTNKANMDLLLQCLQGWFYYKMKLATYNLHMAFITCCANLWVGQMCVSTASVLISRRRLLCFVCLRKYVYHSCMLHIAYFHMRLTMHLALWCLLSSQVVNLRLCMHNANDSICIYIHAKQMKVIVELEHHFRVMLTLAVIKYIY